MVHSNEIENFHEGWTAKTVCGLDIHMGRELLRFYSGAMGLQLFSMRGGVQRWRTTDILVEHNIWQRFVCRVQSLYMNQSKTSNRELSDRSQLSFCYVKCIVTCPIFSVHRRYVTENIYRPLLVMWCNATFRPFQFLKFEDVSFESFSSLDAN